MKLKETIAITIGALAFLLITGVAKANPITNWITNEKNKIVEYQTKKSILNLFNKAKDNVTQD